MGLTLEQIMELQSKKRIKGLYEDKLYDLMNKSDEPGIDPAEEWPLDFGQKQASTLYQGFRNAAEKLQIADQVEILQRDNHVFILVKSRVALALLPSDETNGDTASDVSDESVENTEPVTA